MTKKKLAIVRLKKLELSDRLQKYLREYGIKKIERRFGFLNILEVPIIQKVAINTGIGKLRNIKGIHKSIESCLQKITDQNPALTKTAKAIANFKIKKHDVVGLKLSVRKRRMFEFLDRTINLAIPRSKDFGIPTLQSFDRTGSLTIGIKDCSVFPETWQVPSSSDVGIGISIVIKPYHQKPVAYLLQNLNFPITKT
ncbi:putative 50S ribosomal subunit protein L5 [Candidatus Tremblaya phenacola PAVE]|nr:putative 50S ribosomal subunit protein L5 [Candidatus Tremblaya phenacola PAVE]